MALKVAVVKSSSTAPDYNLFVETGSLVAREHHEALVVSHTADGGVRIHMRPDPFEPDINDTSTLGWFQDLNAAQLVELQNALEA